MPQRPFFRDQVFLIPPSLDDWLPTDHPARFVAVWLDELTAAEWVDLGINPQPARTGEKRYAPAALLAIWVYGFMTGIRSTRGLEAACRDQVPFRWLSGNQQPDHNTLARFYRRHRGQLPHLFQRRVQTAVHAGLVDWALQAVDGTKIAANAAGDRMLTAEQLDALAMQVETAIADLDAQATATDPSGPPALPPALREAHALRERVRQASALVAAKDGPTKANVTDPDAYQMKSKGTIVPAYNAQAVVARVPGDADHPDGRLIVAAEVRTRADDHGLLDTLIAQATARTGRPAAVTVADAGYHDGPMLQTCADQGLVVVIPEPRRPGAESPYHGDHFIHDPDTDTLTCPEGKTLAHWGQTTSRAGEVVDRYGARKADCQPCPVKALCAKQAKRSRVVLRPQSHAARRAHREWLATDDAQRHRKQRGGVVENVFGTLKTRHHARHWLLRGHAAVRAEWTLLALAFNLRTLWACAQRDRPRAVPRW
ncbi:MAG: IS1182 family transposase [Chloroflexia bacterium]|nr:IS1182 family transposase [Chloroflexia bacterium]